MIRKFMISFLGTALVMSVIVGCHHKPTVQELGIVLDTLRADTIAALSDSAAQPHCEVHLQLLTFADKKYAPLNDSLLHSDILSPQYLSLGSKVFTPKEAVDSFIQRYIEDYRSFFSGIYIDEPTVEAATIGYKVTSQVEVGSDNVLNYLANATVDQGTISTNYTICLNLDLTRQRILHLDDIFVHGAEKGLADAIAEQLMEQTSTKSVDALQQAGFFVNSTPYPTENFILKDNGITFVYVTSEIADRSKGEIQVEVKNSAIKPLFKQ